MRVLITRPQTGADATAARLRELGHEAVTIPLSAVAAVDVSMLPDGGDFDAVVLTSGNGIANAPPEVAHRYNHLPCFAVGDHTAAVASSAGFGTIETAEGDVHSLVKLVKERVTDGAGILYPCGQRRRPVLEEELARHGYHVFPLETYSADPVDPAPEDIEALFADAPPDAVLLYSRFGAERLSALVSQSPAGDRFGDLRILCMSENVAEGLAPVLRERAEIAVSPDEEALIALLGRAH